MKIVITKDKIEASLENLYQAENFINEYISKGWKVISLFQYYTGVYEIILIKSK